jgi:hypothetical protein
VKIQTDWIDTAEDKIRMKLIEEMFEEEGIPVVWQDETIEERKVRSCVSTFHQQLSSSETILVGLAESIYNRNRFYTRAKDQTSPGAFHRRIVRNCP